MTRKNFWKYFFSAMIVLLPIASFSTDILKQEYSATQTIKSDSGPFAGEIVSKVYVSGNKERTETKMGTLNMITIVRPDKHVAWLLNPKNKTFQEIDINNATSFAYKRYFDKSTLKHVGNETINGIKTVKYKALSTEEHLLGYLWVSANGIPLKIEKKENAIHGQSRALITLHDLKIERQPSSLFEIPQGFKQGNRI
ncbi:DUF4412 domain-containing protein [Zooshikella harenae]|uniref:DUF4412 domain-containing protein n=1 Tax=Zooshikella harenae TaxID=2827238 RepID=A0ABS5ZEL2_9GAMM|nr:DUF4412 domain-containing protein [Zooshikella harenae]MBU2712509.1 DUF4412 domain-containing protein [Zooshikella harenae]